MFKYEFCEICWGITKFTCLFCHLKISDYRKISESQVEHNLYLRRTWLKCQKYKMLTTGVFSLDEELHRMWGQWLPMTGAESFARDIMRGKPYPEYLRSTDLGNQIDSIVQQLSVQRLILVRDE